MKANKSLLLILVLGLLVIGFSAAASITVVSGPTSLIPDPILVKSSSNQIGLFEFALSQDAGETLSSVTVLVNDHGSSGVTGAGLDAISVYKDQGDSVFNSSTDMLAGTQSSVNVGATTTVAITSNSAIDGGKFFVSLTTSSSWSDTSPADAITVRLESNGIETSGGLVATSEAVTDTIIADTTSPAISSAVAKNTGGTAVKEAGDSVVLEFSEPTNKPLIDDGNVNAVFSLSNGHSFLDGSGSLGEAVWNEEGTMLSLTLSNATTSTTTLPTIEPGDVVTIAGTSIKDFAGNAASGSRTITGDFVSAQDDDTDTDDEEDEKDGVICGNGLRNGRLYKTGEGETVYLAAACALKPFRGAAVFHARGHKFQNIISLDSLNDIVIKQRPVLPASGTLIKGSDATVWFVTKHGNRRGFRSANKFHSLGFNFGQVDEISDVDLNIIPIDVPIEENEDHPDGSLVKCEISATVFQVIGGNKFPFSNADAFLKRGHAWTHIASVDCGRFAYVNGSPIE